MPDDELSVVQLAGLVLFGRGNQLIHGWKESQFNQTYDEKKVEKSVKYRMLILDDPGKASIGGGKHKPVKNQDQLVLDLVEAASAAKLGFAQLVLHISGGDLTETTALSELLFNHGMAQLERQNWEQARTLFEHLVKITPRNYNALNNLALALGQLGDLESELECYEQMVSLQPERFEPRYNMAISLTDLKRNEDAVDAYKKVLELSPDFASAYLNLGVLYGELGQLEKAIAILDEGESRDAKNASFPYNRANLYKRWGRDDDAITEYRLAIERDTEHTDAWTNLGNLLMDQGKVKQAKTAFEQALDHDPDNPYAHEALASLGENAAMVRWRSLPEFLDDLPGEPCEPPLVDSNFCSVCLRINDPIAKVCSVWNPKVKAERERAMMPGGVQTFDAIDEIPLIATTPVIKGVTASVSELDSFTSGGVAVAAVQVLEEEPVAVVKARPKVQERAEAEEKKTPARESKQEDRTKSKSSPSGPPPGIPIVPTILFVLGVLGAALAILNVYGIIAPLVEGSSGKLFWIDWLVAVTGGDPETHVTTVEKESVWQNQDFAALFVGVIFMFFGWILNRRAKQRNIRRRRQSSGSSSGRSLPGKPGSSGSRGRPKVTARAK